MSLLNLSLITLSVLDTISDFVTKIGDKIDDIIDFISEFGADGVWASFLDNFLSVEFNIFGIDFDSANMLETAKSLISWANVKSVSVDGITLYSVGKTIYLIVKPVGIVLLVIFFLWGIIEQCKEIEHVTLERAGWWGFQFFIVYFLVTHAWSICTYILAQIDTVYDDISDSLSITSSGSSEIFDTIYNVFDNTGFFNGLLLTLGFLVLLFPYLGTIIQIFVQLLLRIIKIIFAISLSPIPLAMAVDEDTYRGKAIQYLAYVGSLGVEGILILFSAYVYTLGVQNISPISTEDSLGGISCIIAIMVMNALLLAAIQLSSEFAERITNR